MDTTKQNILMLEKVVEIQKKWKHKKGDWFYSKEPILDYAKNIWVIGNADSYERTSGCRCCSASLDNRKIWLPRQDQLQGMVKGKYTNWQLTQRFWNWLWTKESVTTNLSLEQLWLAFVMEEKYNKIWNGEDWVVEVKEA